MRRETKTIRQAVNKSGKISDRVQVNFHVHVGLADAGDLVDGVPDLIFSIGSRRIENRAKTPIASRAVSRDPLKLPGGRIQTTILLSGPSAFTLMSVIKEIHLNKAGIAA
jgi:hypothetical protein